MTPRQLHAVEPAIEELVARDAHISPAAEQDASGAPMRPLQRLQLLCDEGSLQVVRSSATSERMGDKARPGDGVVGASGRIAGRPIFCFAQDASFAGGSVGAAHAETIVRVQRLARKARMPVIGFVESGGARMQEGLAALGGYARIFSEHVSLSGHVPQISVITGTSAGGGCYSPALTDFVVMTEAASMFLTGPSVVREVTGQQTSTSDLGGTRVHACNGVSQFAVQSDIEAIRLVRRLLGYLPQNAWTASPRTGASEPEGPDPGGLVPLDLRRPYDVREPLRGIIDGGSLLEVSPSWAQNIVTAFGRIDGQPVGIVANQPKRIGGVIDAEASQKGARFVRTCNAFGIALVVLVDTPGFLPGIEQEAIGVIRHGAKLLHAFAEATVPRYTVVLRKAFGGAYITMNSKELGADLTLAWSRAQLGIMGAQQAVGIVNRREIEQADDPAAARERLAFDYAARHLGAEAAARAGHIDDVIRPVETRERLALALAMAGSERGGRGRAGNIPL
ncbi:MAG: acyl-CoA carboxylase subunit beta [Actinomycetota bacterium]|nr:acyl-CoA carboxylase subunit beta [Actinomycetota bacterium]